MYHHLLSRYPLFALLTPKQLNRWIAEGYELTFSTGETIFQEGTAGVWVYLIIQGKIRIVKKSKTNSLVSIGVVGPNEIIGELFRLLLSRLHIEHFGRASNDW